MKKIQLTIFLLIFTFIANNSLNAQVDNNIVAKIGNEIMTSLDVQNEIRTMLILNNKEVNQNNINSTKSLAVKNIIGRMVKKNEINKYNVDFFNELELEDYKKKISISLGIEKADLKKFFEKNKLDYNNYIESNKIELLWKTFIYQKYKNQISINPIEIENELNVIMKKEVRKKKFNLSELELKNEGIEVQNMLKEVYKTIKQNSFEKAVELFSTSPSAINKGNIGWVDEISLSVSFQNELNKIQKGQTTEPIRSLNTITILKINDLKIIENTNLNEDEIRKRIIQKKREDKLNLFSRSHFSELENSILIDFL